MHIQRTKCTLVFFVLLVTNKRLVLVPEMINQYLCRTRGRIERIICVPGAKRSKIFQNQKFESLAFQELVNHSCLGEGECPHPFEQKSDQKFQNKVYRLFFRRKFLKTGVVTLQIFSFVQKSRDQPTIFNNYSQLI